MPAVLDAKITGLYAQLIGELMFVAINTHPAIVQAVNGLARFMTNATSELFTHAKGVVRYLKGHKSRKIVFNSVNPVSSAAASAAAPASPIMFAVIISTTN